MHFSAIGVLAGNITQEDDKLFICVQEKISFVLQS